MPPRSYASQGRRTRIPSSNRDQENSPLKRFSSIIYERQEAKRWDTTDIEQIITSVERLCPGVEVRQLKVSHSGADDDGVWFFKHPSKSFEVQIESSKGMCPFLIETDETPARVIAGSVQETVEALVRLLRC